MREIFSCSDSATVVYVKSVLEQAGVVCLIRNSKLGEISMTNLYVEKDSDDADAKQLIKFHETDIRWFRPDWSCLSCWEVNSGKIEMCAKCETMRPGIHKMSIYEWLEMIRPKPGLYLGKRSIERLDMLLAGIGFGLGMVGLSLRDAHDFHRFHDWVAKRLGFYESTSGWCNMIREKSASDEEALNQFFVLLNEFRKESACEGL